MIYKLFLIIFLSNLYFSLDILKPTKSNIIDCHEPSDLAFDSSNSTFYCVSDEGAIYHFDKNLNLIKKFIYHGLLPLVAPGVGVESNNQFWVPSGKHAWETSCVWAGKS